MRHWACHQIDIDETQETAGERITRRADFEITRRYQSSVTFKCHQSVPNLEVIFLM